MFIYAAFLILQTTATRTWIVAADLGAGLDMSSGLSLNVSGLFVRGLLLKTERLPAPLSGDLLNKWLAVGEKVFISRTQVIQSRLSVGRLDKTILRTLAIAHFANLTLQAISGESIQLSLPECSLCRTLEKLDQWRLLYISKPMFDIDEMVA